MKNVKNKFKSIRIKLFLTLCIAVVVIISFLILTNNFVLESFYLYSKTKDLISIYDRLNTYYSENQIENSNEIETELEKISINNNFDILICGQNNIIVYSTNRNFLSNIDEITSIKGTLGRNENIVYKNKKVVIRKFKDNNNGITFMIFNATLDNNYKLYIRMPVAPIYESVKISNNFLFLIGGFTILIAGVVVSFISRKFTKPILELNDIANKMSKLDFSHKYRITDTEDEVNNLGKSINTMSDKLERTIKQLKETNIELEKDIEEKSKIDEMRKQFISDVSHELKTPIALIQGYSEGLIENVNKDEENRKFYAEVILDEANKMDKLVQQLLELMKLEYGKREFNNKKFNICELIEEVIRKSTVMLEEKNIEVKFEDPKEVYVEADDFYMEQVVTNYFTNAIKHVKEQEGKKIIEISVLPNVDKNTVRISVFNTGDQIQEENLNRIWNRFYKIDESRTREDGGTGIGLSLVKAIMNNYKKEYGVINKDNGVEFYFDLKLVL